LESVVHPRRLFWILLAVAAVQAAYFYPQLPAEVVSRFGTEGEPLHTMSKSGFTLLHLGIIAVIAALFGGVPMDQVPDAFIHIPRKEFWLSAEHREESVRILQDEVFVICNATLLLLTVIFHWVLQANLLEDPKLVPSFTWVPLGLYVAYTLVWTLRLVRRFQTPNGAAVA
jgi:uncharacterized membrane protein